MSYQVIITDSARDSIRDYADYIANEQQAPAAAGHWLTRVFEAADTLAENPRRCALAPEDGYRPYEVRWLGIGEFRLLFTIVDERVVYVIGARHGRRLPRPEDLP